MFPPSGLYCRHPSVTESCTLRRFFAAGRSNACTSVPCIGKRSQGAQRPSMSSVQEAMPEKLSLTRKRMLAGAAEVGPFAEERPDARRYGVGGDEDVARGAGRRRHGAVGVSAADAGDASFGSTGRENRAGLHVVGHEGVYGDRHRAAQGRFGAEDAVGGREDRRRGVGCGGLTLFRAAENGFVDRSCGDAGRQIAARTDQSRLFGPQDDGRAVSFGAERFRAAENVEFELRAVAAVVFGFDADAPFLALGGADEAALPHDGIEAVGRFGQLRQPDHLVARGELHGVVAHGVAAARKVVREAVHAVFEPGIAVHGHARPP